MYSQNYLVVMLIIQKWEVKNYLPESLKIETLPYVLQATPELKDNDYEILK